MDYKRAKEIVSSPNMVDVTHNNAAIYMEKVDDSTQTCTIHYFNKPDQKSTVPLSSLVEHT